MSDRPDPRTDATAFREVVSQWQLAARTEVKRSSSLPTSMFDACDPMLEARLAESVEAMMNCLHDPGRLLRDSKPQKLELRTETVTADELRALPRRARGRDGDLDVDQDVRAEYLSLLVDACITGDDYVTAAARALLRRDFALDGDLDAATTQLHEQVRALLAEDGETTPDALADLCDRIAADVLLRSPDEPS